MLRSRYHRHSSAYAASAPVDRTRLIARSAIAVLALIVAWYLGSKITALFNYSAVRRSGAVLSLDQPEAAVDVSLQGAEAQRAENNLKVYQGDRVVTRSSSAMLSFFDGTRVRLDEGTELSVAQSDEQTASPSVISLKLERGRVWMLTPSVGVYSGAVLRSVVAPDYDASVPPDFSGLLSPSLVIVTRSSGLGATLALSIPKRSPASIILGEGQMFTFNGQAHAAIEQGTDPYEFRDPANPQLFKDTFIVQSYAQMRPIARPAAQAPQAGVGSGDTDLTVTAPENQATVTGKSVNVQGTVSSRVRAVHINGYEAQLKDGGFSLDLALGSDASVTIQVDAADDQGITISSVTRTVKMVKQTFSPVRITAPVGSGGTLTTRDPEVEITGEAPPGTLGIIVSGYRLQLFKPGNRTWSYLASAKLGNLATGKNIFSVVAESSDGVMGPASSITIDYEPTGQTGSGGTVASRTSLHQNAPLRPGTLTVDAPVKGTTAEVKDKEVVIEGHTDGSTAAVAVNGYTLSLYIAGKTTWNYIASTELGTMKPGRNVYRIVARNSAGEIVDVLEYTIVFQQ